MRLTFASALLKGASVLAVIRPPRPPPKRVDYIVVAQASHLKWWGGLNTTVPTVASLAPDTCEWKGLRGLVAVNSGCILSARTRFWDPSVCEEVLTRGLVWTGSEMVALNQGFTLAVRTRPWDSSACEDVFVPRRQEVLQGGQLRMHT